MSEEEAQLHKELINLINAHRKKLGLKEWVHEESIAQGSMGHVNYLSGEAGLTRDKSGGLVKSDTSFRRGLAEYNFETQVWWNAPAKEVARYIFQQILDNPKKRRLLESIHPQSFGLGTARRGVTATSNSRHNSYATIRFRRIK